MSDWTHGICDECWRSREGNRVPHRLSTEYRDVETCCFCGRSTDSGIFVRETPSLAPHCPGHAN